MMRQFPALRGIAIILVVLHHTIALGTTAPFEYGFSTPDGIGKVIIQTFSLLGWVAVPTFLFISGSFFAYAANGKPPKISLKVVLANLKHLLWPYIIWSIVYYLVLIITTGNSYSLLDTVKNLLVGFPYHFIPLLFFFYALSPLLVWLSNRIRWWYIFILILAYQIFLIVVLDAKQYNLVVPAWMDKLTLPVLRRTMADWAIYFPLGLLLTLYPKPILSLLKKWQWVFVVLTTITIGLAVMHSLGIVNMTWTRHIYPLTFVLFITGLRRDQIPFIGWFEDVGKKAYGLYLLHLIVINLALAFIAFYVPVLKQNLYPMLIILFIIALWIPLGLMRLANKLFIARINKILFG